MRPPANFPKIDDVANEINDVGIIVAEEIKKCGRLSCACAEMDVRNEDGAVAAAGTVLSFSNVVRVLHAVQKHESCFSCVTVMGLTLDAHQHDELQWQMRIPGERVCATLISMRPPRSQRTTRRADYDRHTYSIRVETLHRAGP
jgi:hypothetical protein